MHTFRTILPCLALAVATATTQAQSLLPTTELTIGGITLQAELAATDAARMQGLMHRTALPPNHGMLFVFNEPTFQCFWMKNTPLPLSIAFIDANGVITRLLDMAPHNESAHCPPDDILYALEMEQGWFKRYAIKTGQTVTGLPR